MKVLLEGPILTRSGYGEHARLVFRSIKDDQNMDIYINPLNWGNTGWVSEVSSQDEMNKIEEAINKFSQYFQFTQSSGTKMDFDLHIHVGILNEFEKKAPKAISVTAGIETDRVDPSWLIKTHQQQVDKIIVPSQHSRDMFLKTSFSIENEKENTRTAIELRQTTEVDVVPYPCKSFSPETSELEMNLDTKFNFLSVALLGPRKNMENMIKWFAEEFKDDSDVGLIVKASTVNGSLMDREHTMKALSRALKNQENRKCKIYLLHGDLSEPEIHSLYNNEKIKCYLTATHGEGYGLPIFEAAYSGMPIIATNWSGHLDFLSAKIKEGKKEKNKPLFAKVDYEMKEIQKSAVWQGILMEGSKWAYPRENSFKKQLRNMYKNYGMYKKWATTLKSSLEKTHSESIVLEKMKNSILSLTSTSQEEEVFIL